MVESNSYARDAARMLVSNASSNMRMALNAAGKRSMLKAGMPHSKASSTSLFGQLWISTRPCAQHLDEL